MASFGVLENVEEDPLQSQILWIKIYGQFWVILNLPGVVNSINSIIYAFLLENFYKVSIHVMVIFNSTTKGMSHPFRYIAVGFIPYKH